MYQSSSQQSFFQRTGKDTVFQKNQNCEKVKKSPKRKRLGLLYLFWSPKWDSNPHGFLLTILSRACLPIPPFGDARLF